MPGVKHLRGCICPECQRGPAAKRAAAPAPSLGPALMCPHCDLNLGHQGRHRWRCTAIRRIAPALVADPQRCPAEVPGPRQTCKACTPPTGCPLEGPPLPRPLEGPAPLEGPPVSLTEERLAAQRERTARWLDTLKPPTRPATPEELAALRAQFGFKPSTKGTKR